MDLELPTGDSIQPSTLSTKVSVKILKSKSRSGSSIAGKLKVKQLLKYQAVAIAVVGAIDGAVVVARCFTSPRRAPRSGLSDNHIRRNRTVT
jgi:hypothetical protein